MPFVDDPIVNMVGVTNPPLQNEANFPRESTTPGWGAVLQAEFETQNTIGSISNYESSPDGHAFDPNFRLADALKGTRWENNPGLFVTARNQAHFDALVRDHERDERNRRIVEDSSWGQYLPAMVLAQAVDPVNWLSLGTMGALRLAGRGGFTLASRTGAIATGTAVDTTIQEGVLQATQVNRTLGESLSGIGGSAILGGLIGHVGSRLLLREELDALSGTIEREVAAFERGETPRGNLTGETAGVGAERVSGSDATPSPRLKFSFGADYLSQRMGPQQRLTHSSSDVARRFANELIETPYFYRENTQGFVVAPRGDAMGMPGAVQTRIGLWEEPIMRAIHGMRELYLEYRGAEHQNFAQRAAFNVADRFGRTGGARSEVEFRQAVTDAVAAGGQHTIPQVAKAAQRILDVIKQVEDAGVRSGVLKEGQSALPRSWMTAKIIREKPEFKKRVIEHLKRRRSQFQGEWDTVQSDRAKAASKRAEETDDARIQRELARARDAAERDAARSEPNRYEGLPLSADEVETLVGFWQYAKEVLARKKPESLTSFIVRMGGLEDPGGDVRSMLGRTNARPGLIRKAGSDAGRGLDDWALRAWENGFFPDHLERPTIDEFLDRLGDDLQSGRVTRAEDAGYWDDLQVADEMIQELESYGISPRDFRTEAAFRKWFGEPRTKGAAPKDAGAPRSAAPEPDAVRLTAEQERVRNRAVMVDAELEKLADTVINRMLLRQEGRAGHDLHKTLDSEGFLRDDATLTPEDFALPYGEVREFLETDSDMLLRLMHRSLIPDIEVAFRFGSTDAAEFRQARIDEGNRAINAATSPQERAKLHKAVKRDLDDMRDAIDRLAGRYGLPDDPAHWAIRTGRFARDASIWQKFGLAAFTSVPETARLITARGISAVFADLMYPMVRDWSKLVEAGHDLRMATHALDHYVAGRAMAIADGAEDWGSLPKIDRYSREATKTFMRWTGLPKLTDWQKSASGLLVSKNLLEAAEATAAGTATRKQTEMLSRLAISKRSAITIAEQFKKHGVKDDARVWAAETAKWDPEARAAREAFLGGIRREVNRLITTPGLDTPNVMASETGPLGAFGKALFQFKSFGISAYERVLVSGLQQNDVPFWASVVTAVGLAMVVNEARKAAFGDRRGKSFDERWNDPNQRDQMFIDAVDKAGVLGWLTEPNKVLERAGLGVGSMIGAPAAPRFGRSLDMMGEAAGPAIGGGFDALFTGGKLGARLVGKSNWSEADTRHLKQVVPFVGLHWMRLGLEQLGADEAINRALDARPSPRR
jgi:hypothetical protein